MKKVCLLALGMFVIGCILMVYFGLLGVESFGIMTIFDVDLWLLLLIYSVIVLVTQFNANDSFSAFKNAFSKEVDYEKGADYEKSIVVIKGLQKSIVGFAFIVFFISISEVLRGLAVSTVDEISYAVAYSLRIWVVIYIFKVFALLPIENMLSCKIVQIKGCTRQS